jgi:hypothetical protein
MPEGRTTPLNSSMDLWNLRKEILYAKYWSLNVTTEFWNGRK